MRSPEWIVKWLDKHVEGMRKSRQKTLATVVFGALKLKGLGVLALGRAMAGPTAAKHRIKRVHRFLSNPKVEIAAVGRSLFQLLTAGRGPVVVVFDWTDLGHVRQLVAAVPRSKRALPIASVTIEKQGPKGRQVAAERRLLREVLSWAQDPSEVWVIGDRGFGHTRWLSDILALNAHFVQRVSQSLTVEQWRPLGALTIPRGGRPRRWGKTDITKACPFSVHLVTTFEIQANQPWLLVSDTPLPAAAVVRLYKKRMWIEAMFRDLKHPSWGMGLRSVRLKDPARYDRLLIIVALTYLFLFAFGTVADALSMARRFQANSVRHPVLNRIRLGFYLIAEPDIPWRLIKKSLYRLCHQTGDS